MANALVELEIDALSPALKTIRGTNNQRLFITAHLEVTKQWLLGFDYFMDEGNYYSSQGGSSNQMAPAKGYGFRWSYFFGDIGANSMFVSMGTGSMDRTFINSGYDDFSIKGSYTLFEVGRRANIIRNFFVSGNIAYLASNLDSFHSFGSSQMEADTHYTLLKLTLGLMY